MKKILSIIVALMISTSAANAVIVGYSRIVSSSPVTVSQTAETSYLTNIYNGAGTGQSITAPISGVLKKFRFKTGSAGVGGTGSATVRCGSSENLTSGYVSSSVSVPSVSTVYEVVFSSGLPTTSGNIYYCAVSVASATYSDRISVAYTTNTSAYSGGTAQGFSSWMLTPASYDLWFEADFE